MTPATELDIVRVSLQRIFNPLGEVFPTLRVEFVDPKHNKETAAHFDLLAAARITTGAVSRPLLVERHKHTGDYAVRLHDGYNGKKTEWPYSVIVPRTELHNPLAWLIDVEAATQKPRSASYLNSDNMIVAQTMPGNAYAASGAAIGFLLSCIIPDLMETGLSKIATSLSEQRMPPPPRIATPPKL